MTKPDALDERELFGAWYFKHGTGLYKHSAEAGFIAGRASISTKLTALESAVRKVHAAKGRHHTQIAMCDLYDLVSLPNVRPEQGANK